MFSKYYNPCITGGKNPLYNPTNQGEMMVQASRTQSVFIRLAMWKRSSKMSIDRDYTVRPYDRGLFKGQWWAS